MGPDRHTQIEQILGLTDRIFGALLPTVPKEVLELDVTMPQLKIMLMLFINGPVRMSAIAADLGITLATATGLVDRLVERELVSRENNPGDRRVVMCRLSEPGHQTVSRIWNSVRKKMSDILLALDDDTLCKLDFALQNMLANAHRVDRD
jgi:DNA-binding MarR family transcriptional regulator